MKYTRKEATDVGYNIFILLPGLCSESMMDLVLYRDRDQYLKEDAITARDKIGRIRRAACIVFVEDINEQENQLYNLLEADLEDNLPDVGELRATIKSTK